MLTSFVFQEFDESYNPTIQENVKAGYHIKGIDKKILIEFIGKSDVCAGCGC